MKLKLMYLIPVLLVQFITAKLLYKKNKVTIKPKYKEKILLHERKKNLHLYTSLRTTKSQINKF